MCDSATMVVKEVENEDAPTSCTEPPKLKRSFTLTRNPFNGTRMSKRKYQTKENDSKDANSDGEKNKKIFRRPSIRKFINRIAQHINGVGGVYNGENNRVPSVGLQTWGPDDTPGVTGLINHGNTCFINAVLQCIAHTDILAEYFVLDRYKLDLSKRNKLNSKKFGSKGEITEQLAVVLKSLWACQYNPELTILFKQVVEKHGNQYKGRQQHDALEFLQWLLDKVHEDLNTASKKKFKSIKTSGRPDEVIAAETLENYKRCNNSFIHGVFQAQYRSSLTCSRCQTQSNTFDPFQCISVQLPQVNKQSIFVSVLYTSQQPRQVKIGLSVPSGGTISDLRDNLESDTGIDRGNMLITEIFEDGFHRTFSDAQSVSAISEADPIYCVEVPPLKDADQDEGTTSAYVLLCWINVLMNPDGNILKGKRFGSPYIMQVSRETSYDDLQKLILKEMAPILHDDILTSNQTRGIFKMRISDPACDENEPPCYLGASLEHPLFMEAIDQSLALCSEEGGPPHVKLILEWTEASKKSVIADDNDVFDEHSSVKQLKSQAFQGTPLTLQECLKDYTGAETLTDAWRCPHCQQYQPVIKTLDVWSLPDILIVHFKRFRQQTLRGNSSTKLTTMVDFPVEGFDMSPHLANSTKNNSNASTPTDTSLELTGNNWSMTSPWKKTRKPSTSNDNVYDLYAVCYHHGTNIGTGHYTAACKNPYDNQWYLYDDSKVTNLSKQTDDVTSLLVNNTAYILFYQRRNGSYANSSSSSAASTSSVGSTNDHWVSKMPKFTPPKHLRVSPSADNKKPATPTGDDVSNESPPPSDTTPTNNEEVVNFRNSQNTLRSNKSLEITNDSKNVSIEKLSPQKVYTTSIYINADGDVDIATTCDSEKSPVLSQHRLNAIDDDDDVPLRNHNPSYLTTASIHRSSEPSRTSNISRTHLNWMSPQPLRKTSHSQQSM